MKNAILKNYSYGGLVYIWLVKLRIWKITTKAHL